MTPVNWTAPALADLRAISLWLISEASKEVASRTLDQIRQRANFLAQFPHGGRMVLEHDFRILRVIQAPYLIVYRLTALGIDILRLRHEKEDWQVET